jgi:ribonuclease P protein component
VTASVPEASNHGVPRKSFLRNVRLLRHADFERVYKQGRRHYSTSMSVFYLARQESGTTKSGATKSETTTGKALASGVRVGFTVGRVLGGAVQRNRMKRRLREAVRLSLPVKANADVVINPKKSLLTMDFDALLNEVRRAFVVIEQKCG